MRIVFMMGLRSSVFSWTIHCVFFAPRSRASSGSLHLSLISQGIMTCIHLLLTLVFAVSLGTPVEIQRPRGVPLTSKVISYIADSLLNVHWFWLHWLNLFNSYFLLFKYLKRNRFMRRTSLSPVSMDHVPFLLTAWMMTTVTAKMVQMSQVLTELIF